ncbi:DUF456 domain-containing protein [Desulfothermobacter acidiphilus]|uniref:DUF456 domain-containing protein n=1 Tax=Desulfothermobacter acidiphilus TaxID=1938353 RepID=UPI003F8910C2
MTVLAWIVAVLFFLAGLVGILFPVLPGVPLVFLGILAFGLLTGWHNFTWYFCLAQAVFVAAAFLIDYLATAWGVRRQGGSRLAAWGSVLGLLAGVLLLGPLGIVVGPFLGAFLAELLPSRGDVYRALRVGWGSLVGLLGGTLIKLLLAATMIGWFLWVTLYP